MRHTQSHAHRHICVLDHLCELLEADLAVVVKIRFHDGLVHDLVIPKSAKYPWQIQLGRQHIIPLSTPSQELTCCNC